MIPMADSIQLKKLKANIKLLLKNDADYKTDVADLQSDVVKLTSELRHREFDVKDYKERIDDLLKKIATYETTSNASTVALRQALEAIQELKVVIQIVAKHMQR